MSPDRLTLCRLLALEELLSASNQVIRRVRLQSMAGDLSPDEATVIVRDVAESIAKFCGEGEP